MRDSLRSAVWSAFVVVMAMTLGLFSPAPVGAAPPGQLTQLSGVSGCVSDGTTSGCAVGRGLYGAGWVTISPDGNYAYVAAFNGSTVATFARNTTTGVLTQLSGTAGCIGETGDGVT